MMETSEAMNQDSFLWSFSPGINKIDTAVGSCCAYKVKNFQNVAWDRGCYNLTRIVRVYSNANVTSFESSKGSTLSSS